MQAGLNPALPHHPEALQGKELYGHPQVPSASENVGPGLSLLYYPRTIELSRLLCSLDSPLILGGWVTSRKRHTLRKYLNPKIALKKKTKYFKCDP